MVYEKKIHVYNIRYSVKGNHGYRVNKDLNVVTFSCLDALHLFDQAHQDDDAEVHLVQRRDRLDGDLLVDPVIEANRSQLKLDLPL